MMPVPKLSKENWERAMRLVKDYNNDRLCWDGPITDAYLFARVIAELQEKEKNK